MSDYGSDRRELESLILRKLTITIVFLAVVFAGLGLAGLRYDAEIVELAEWIYKEFGFSSLCLLIFLSDTMLSPFPPDFVLFVVSRSQMKEQWFFYVSILGAISFLGGVAGWYIGRFLNSISFVKKHTDKFRFKYEGLIQRFALWVIILGAMTPLPFSVTCWSAGSLNVRRSVVIIGSLFRIPRFLGVYLLLYYSSFLKDWVNF